MTTHAHLLPEYKRLREVRFHLGNTLARSLDKETIQEAGRAVGLLQRDTLVFDTEDQVAVLMDYGIYNLWRDGRNALQRYVDESPPLPGSRQSVVLQAMLKAYYSILQVLETEPGVGVSVLDRLRGDTGFLVDVGFGTTARSGLILATRVIPHEDFWTTGGAALPVSPAVLSRIEKELKPTFASRVDFSRLTHEQESQFAALVIRNCLASNASVRVAYAEPSQVSSPQQSVSALPGRPRANRNDPCPCGSGRKFKTCCGRR